MLPIRRGGHRGEMFLRPDVSPSHGYRRCPNHRGAHAVQPKRSDQYRCPVSHVWSVRNLAPLDSILRYRAYLIRKEASDDRS